MFARAPSPTPAAPRARAPSPEVHSTGFYHPLTQVQQPPPKDQPTVAPVDLHSILSDPRCLQEVDTHIARIYSELSEKDKTDRLFRDMNVLTVRKDVARVMGLVENALDHEPDRTLSGSSSSLSFARF